VLQLLVNFLKLSENLRLLETTNQRKLSFALSKDESATRKEVEAWPCDHDHRKIKTALRANKTCVVIMWCCKDIFGCYCYLYVNFSFKMSPCDAR